MPNDLVFNYSEANYRIRPAVYNYDPGQTFYLTIAERDLGISEDDQISYKLNNHGHRSDDFKKLDSEQTNVLFAGCSTTFGEGIKQEHRWSDRLHEELKKYYTNLGDLQVLSYPGFGAETIVTNIFKYCKNFGLPKIIFLLIPDFLRSIGFDQNNKNHFIPNIKMDYANNILKENTSSEEMYGLFINNLRVLDIFCEINKIKLFIGTWDSSTDSLLKKSYINSYTSLVSDYNETFNQLKFLKLYDGLSNYDKKFAYDSRDGHHPGILVHQYICDAFLKGYIES